MRTIDEHGIEPIDLVCVNLYPFERTAATRGVEDAEVIENIDIGGPTLIRAAAKNHAYSAVVVSPESYDAVLDELETSDGRLSQQTRQALALDAFAYTARYDTAIARWFGEKEEEFPSLYVRAYEKVLDLSYGENPHQRAAYYAQTGARTDLLSMVSKLHGKALSFNNLLDLDSGRKLVGRVRGAGLRDHQAQQPVRMRAGGRCRRGVPQGARVRPDERVRRRRLLQPQGRSLHGRGGARAVRRADLRPGLRRRRARGPPAEEEHPHPRQPGAARLAGERARHQARARRDPDPAPRRGHGAARRDAGGHEAQADRAGVGRAAVRVEGRPSTCARTRSCWRRTWRRSASARAR